MSYFASTKNYDFKILKDNLPTADTVMGLLADHAVPDPVPDLKAAGVSSLDDIIRYYGWKPEYDDDGSMVGLYHEYDDLDSTILHALAPFVEEGSTIDMVGEDGEFRFMFNNGDVDEVSPSYGGGETPAMDGDTFDMDEDASEMPLNERIISTLQDIIPELRSLIYKVDSLLEAIDQSDGEESSEDADTLDNIRDNLENDVAGTMQAAIDEIQNVLYRNFDID